MILKYYKIIQSYHIKIYLKCYLLFNVLVIKEINLSFNYFKTIWQKIT
jgi:hypothetical protein